MVEINTVLQARERVSVKDFGAIGSGLIADAAANQAAFVAAAATGKEVVIPYTSAGYHLGAPSGGIDLGSVSAVGPGTQFVGEKPDVKLITTATDSLFNCIGFDNPWGMSDVTIDASGAGAASTLFRMKTASRVVYKGRFKNLTVNGAAEIFGDEASSNYVTDLRVENLLVTAPKARNIYLRHSRGFINFIDTQFQMALSPTPQTWECARFADAIGLEINRFDVSGGPTPTTATVTITIASPGVITWTAHGKSAGDTVSFSTTGALPTGISARLAYYVKTVLDANTFTVSFTNGGSAVVTTGSQSGVHTGTNKAYKPGARALAILNSTSVWLNRLEADGMWGDPCYFDTVRLLRCYALSSFASLGNAVTAQTVTESVFVATSITGASTTQGDGSGTGLNFISGGNNVVAGLTAQYCTASALLHNGSVGNVVNGYNAYNNAGYAYALLGAADENILASGRFYNNGHTVLNSASGTKNQIGPIVGYSAGGLTVATLPAAADVGVNGRAFVTDANAVTFHSTVAAGGSNKVPVVSDGTNWLIG